MCENGYVRVKDNLTCEHFGNIFVSGDAASLTKHPDLPKSGLTAVRQGQVLVKNIQRRLNEEPLVSYKPQFLRLSLVGTTNDNAIATYGQLALRGSIFWHLKILLTSILLKNLNHLKKWTTTLTQKQTRRWNDVEDAAPK